MGRRKRRVSSQAVETSLATAQPGTPDGAAKEALDQLGAAIDRLAEVELSTVSDGVLAELSSRTEQLARRTAAITDRSIVEASDRDLPFNLGYRDVRSFMSRHLHIGHAPERYRVIAATGTFHSVTSDVLEPGCPTLAQHLTDGAVAPAHARAVLDVLEKIPHGTPIDTRMAAEVQMSDYATHFTPLEITNLGSRLLAHLDPDGTVTDDADRKRQRRLSLGRQNAQLMSRLTADLDPATRVRLDVLLDTWAQPGMNNPADPDSPRGAVGDAEPEALAAAVERDCRSVGQRNHDALSALLTRMLDTGTLGKSHRGLPIQVIVKTTLRELEEGAGLAHTASGALLPIKDLVEMAAGGAQQYLAVFGEHTSVPLYLGRSRRLANLGQRLASFASDGGEMCSAPGCTQPATRVEMHHAARDWVDGGLTNIDELAPACEIHNRMVGSRPGQYRTRIITEGPDAGRVAWRLNSQPHLPPNPEYVNRATDVPSDFRDHLTRVRAELFETHTPAPSAQPEPGPTSDVERHLAGTLLSFSDRRSVNVSRTVCTIEIPNAPPAA